MKLFATLSLMGLCVCGCEDTNRTTPNVDNSAINQRDQIESTKTPLDQNENQKDISTTANIRQQVVATKMSTNAQNIKIITQDGKVTLRGPVANDEEKMQIEKIARKVAGDSNVNSQIDISTSN